MRFSMETGHLFSCMGRYVSRIYDTYQVYDEVLIRYALSYVTTASTAFDMDIVIDYLYFRRGV